MENAPDTVEVTAHEKFEKFIKDNSIDLKAKFVPMSISRNADNLEGDTPLFRNNQLSINWKVTISGNNNKVTIDYQQGIGLLGYDWLSVYHPIKLSSEAKKANEFLYDAIENGTLHNVKTIEQFKSRNFTTKSPIKTPELKDILECMCLDAEVVHHANFESWANEYGYETDSRKAEKIYNDCKEIASKFLKVVGSVSNLQELQEIMREMDESPAPPKKNKM